ncbi:sensor histidine kinase [Kribbella sindirgiensis]|uniref:histidine kinase n=1 Tax=Kribbella sindirgiensis TaxID=1124744 RepID=A0A4R0I753_9ACTN|nr:sensor histidine kinase [Kribbella sindirgiensis]TCC16760.1 sensor histidine kinase [Kribbella sindirgiensis]
MAGLEQYVVRRPWLTDAVIAVAVLVGAAVIGVNLSDPDGARPADAWLADGLAAVSSLVLFGARRLPRVTVAVAAACVVALGTLGYLLTPLVLAPVMVALYWLARALPSRLAWTYGAIATAVVVAVAVGPTLDRAVALRAIGPALWLVLPLALGSRSQLQAAYLRALQARAAYAERTREEEARLRVAEERLRIARDLHDVVAHHMAVANAQAGTAAHLLDSGPDVSRKLLADLQTTTSTVMLEMRATIGVLRATDDSGADSLQPAPGLAQLPELVGACAAAGLQVTVEIQGEPRDLPPSVDLTAYRIVQEALTNATKHSGSSTAYLLMTYSAASLTITVSNAGAADAQPATGGYGLIGMRERANAVGGRVQVTDTGGGPFEVVTTLPLHLQAPVGS